MDFTPYLKHVPTAVMLFLVTSIAGGVSAWYDLKGDVSKAANTAVTVKMDLDKHETAHALERREILNGMESQHQETLSDLREIRRMLMVPPEQRARKFSGAN